MENKPLIRQILGDNRTNKMTMDRLEVLTKSLNDRYLELQAASLALKLDAASSARSTPTKSLPSPSSKGRSHRSHSNSPKKSPLDPHSMRLMSAQQLFEAMKSQNVLIMDCRSSEDYEQSHLTYPLAFNVPQEFIHAG